MLTLPYRERSYLRFVSTRTDETIFELKMLAGALIVWGRRYRPSEFDARLDDGEVRLSGTLSDHLGVVVTFGGQTVVTANFRVEVGELAADFDGSWRRDES